MDSFQAPTIVYNRIRGLEPEDIANKIVGHLLLRGCHEEMTGLAYGPDHLIRSLIHKVKAELELVSKPSVSIPVSSAPGPGLPILQYSPVSSPTPLRLPNRNWESQVNAEHIHNAPFAPVAYSDSVPRDFGLENRSHFMRLDNQLELFDLVNQSSASDFYNPRATLSRRHQSPTEFPIKDCHFFSKGSCKNGSNCRYFHRNPFPDSFSQVFSPHGQHSVVLAEDVPKYMGNCGARNGPGPIVNGSQRIYLTFRAESTFTEEDVYNYFAFFGPVEDVRIPWRKNRMFGFVTFVSADTVKMILSRGNPHCVCGAHVFVKPYRDKSELSDRKYQEQLEHQMSQNPLSFVMDSEIQPGFESSRLMRKPFIDENELGLEVQTRRLSQLQLPRRPLAQQESDEESPGVNLPESPFHHQ